MVKLFEHLHTTMVKLFEHLQASVHHHNAPCKINKLGATDIKHQMCDMLPSFPCHFGVKLKKFAIAITRSHIVDIFGYEISQEGL